MKETEKIKETEIIINTEIVEKVIETYKIVNELKCDDKCLLCDNFNFNPKLFNL